MTIVRVTSGGIPVVESERGLPYYEAENGYGIPVTFGSTGIPLGRTGSGGIQLTNSSFAAGSAQGTAIGTLSVTGGTGTYTFTLSDSASNKAQVAGTNGVNLQAGSASASAGAFNITVHADNGAGSTFDRTFSISATAVPANTVAPAITGSAVQGATLTSSTGTWTGFPTPTYTYQWKRAGVAISGATSSIYVVQNADVGSAITVTVTGTNSVGSASATSSATATVTKTTLSYTPVTSASQNSSYTGATPSTTGGTAPYTYSISGTLPTGLSLNTSTGVISGTPTVVQTASGLVLIVTDANGVTDSSASFSIAVTSVPFTYDANTYWFDFTSGSNTLDTNTTTTIAAAPELISGKQIWAQLNKALQPLSVAGGANFNQGTGRLMQFGLAPRGVTNGKNGWYLAFVCTPTTGNGVIMEISRNVSSIASRMSVDFTTSRNFRLRAAPGDGSSISAVITSVAKTLGVKYHVEILWDFDADTCTMWIDGVDQALSASGGPWSNFPSTDPLLVTLGNSGVNGAVTSFDGSLRNIIFYDGVPSSGIRSSISTYLQTL